ncbi:MAG: diguanylate cyclase [Gemmatimonadaceae bacterium]|nr:diguanylate cyclase [Gemmatimonadaceae bacterium]
MEREGKYRILVVDDNVDNVELLRARLESRGYEVEGANGGEEALAMLKVNPPDLMLLDWMMPKVDGMEVVRRLKADKSLPFIPVIMQTALDSTEHKVEGLDAGADDYITKPINFPELDARVKSLLRIKKLQEDLSNRERELEEMNERLHRISQTDALTGIPNRRSLEEKLDEMWAHSQRLHEPLSVVMCDIDKFKSVNDTYGHQVGDIVLKDFANLLKDAVREIDRIGRYGGEEFLLLLPGTPLESAVTFADRVREIAKEHTFSFEGGTLSRTMSCGVAAWPHPDIRDQDALLKAADDALYVAKETGRNKVVRYDSPEFRSHIEGEKASNGDKSSNQAAHRADDGVKGSEAIGKP